MIPDGVFITPITNHHQQTERHDSIRVPNKKSVRNRDTHEQLVATVIFVNSLWCCVLSDLSDLIYSHPQEDALYTANTQLVLWGTNGIDFTGLYPFFCSHGHIVSCEYMTHQVNIIRYDGVWNLS